MKPAGTTPELTTAEPARPAPAERWPGLEVVAVYQNRPSRERVEELCTRVTQSIGGQSVQLQSWSFRELSEPELLQDAALAAADADVMVVSFRATRKFHPRFHAWVAAWRTRRRRPDGTLIALIEANGRHGVALDHTRKYLRQIAAEAHLEFLCRECAPAAAPVDAARTGSNSSVPVAPAQKSNATPW